MSRNLEINILLSTQLTDFLFTAKDNLLYGWMVNNPFWRYLRTSYTNIHSTEHSLFLGLTAYLFLIITLILLIRDKFEPDQKMQILFFMTIFVVAFILSFGPSGPYFLVYNFVPFADSLRVPSRFMIIGFLMLAVVLALTWQKISKNLKFSTSFFLIVILLISFEYRHDLGTPYHENVKIKQFYLWLEDQEQVKAIVELPMFNFLPGQRPASIELYHDTKYLFYGLIHKKRIVNGFNSFIPPDVIEFGDWLTFNFPSREHIQKLKDLGIDTIIFHSDEFLDKTIFGKILEKLDNLGVEQIYNDQNIVAYYIK